MSTQGMPHTTLCLRSWGRFAAQGRCIPTPLPQAQGSPWRCGTSWYLHGGILQHLDGVLGREVELGLADPAREVVAHGGRAQLVADLKVQRLLTPAQVPVPCDSDSTPGPAQREAQ